MAIYNYICPICGAKKNKRFKMSDVPQFVDCKCGNCMQKQLSLPAIQFKGKGFAKNDLIDKEKKK